MKLFDVKRDESIDRIRELGTEKWEATEEFWPPGKGGFVSGLKYAVSIVISYHSNLKAPYSMRTLDVTAIRNYLPLYGGAMKVKIDVDACVSKYFILAVDDEPRIEEIMGIQLQKGGYEYVSFHDPRKAMEFVVGNHDLLDLAILDIKMPVMSGIEMANEIFKIESALPVILITGVSEDIEVRHTNNVKTLLHKPITKNEFLDAVRKSLHS